MEWISVKDRLPPCAGRQRYIELCKRIVDNYGDGSEAEE